MPQPTVRDIWIDERVCLAHYICVAEAPLVFEEREGQWTVQVLEGADSLVLSQNTEELFYAAAACPMNAIHLTLETGEVVDGDSEIIRTYLGLNKKTR